METLVELNETELLNIQGGDKFMHDLGVVIGKIGGWLENFAEACEGMELGSIHAK